MLQNYILIVSSLLLLNSVASQTKLDPCEGKPCESGEICISNGNMDFVCVNPVSSLGSTIGSRKIIPMQNHRFQVGYSRQDSLVAPDDKPSAHDEFILNMMTQPQSTDVPVNRPSVQRNRQTGKERIKNVKNTVRIATQNMDPNQSGNRGSNDEDMSNLVQNFGRNPPLRNPFNVGFAVPQIDQSNPQNQMEDPVVPGSNDQEILNSIQSFGNLQEIPNPLATARIAMPQTMDENFLNAKPNVEVPTKPVTPPAIHNQNDDDQILNTNLQEIPDPLATARIAMPQTMDDSFLNAKPKIEVKPVTPSAIPNQNDDDHILNTIFGFNPRPLPVSNPFNAGRFPITKINDEKMKTVSKNVRINAEVPKPVKPFVVQSSTANVQSKNTKPIGRLFPVKTALPVIRAEMDSSEDDLIASFASGSQSLQENNKNTKIVSKDVQFNPVIIPTTTSKKMEIVETKPQQNFNRKLISKDLLPINTAAFEQPKSTENENDHDDHIISMITGSQEKPDLMKGVEGYDDIDNFRPRETQNEFSLEEENDAAGNYGTYDTSDTEESVSEDEQENDNQKPGEIKKALSDSNQVPLNQQMIISSHQIISSGSKMPFNSLDRNSLILRRPTNRISAYNPTEDGFASSRADLINQMSEAQQPEPAVPSSIQNVPETHTSNINNKPTHVKTDEKVAPKFSGHARLNQEQNVIQPAVQPVANEKDVSRIINSILPNKPGDKKLPSQLPASFNKNRYSLKNFILSTTTTTVKTPVHDSRAIFEAVQKMDEHEQGLIDGVLNVNDETTQSQTMAKKPYCNGHEFGDQIAHPEDSTKFIVCQKDGEYIVMRCPGKLKYNKYKNRCDHTDRKPEKACLSSPCLNNGTCMDTVDYDFICECKRGYSGDICDKYADPCAFSPCGDENVCNPFPPELHMSAFYCVCDGGSTYGLKSCDDNSNKYKNPCNDDSHQTYYPTDLRKSLFIHCENNALTIKQCKSPLEWSQEKLSCIRPNNRAT